MNEPLFKKICSKYVTGVTVITSRKDKINYGFTANSFTSVSINPLLVLFCLKNDSSSVKALEMGSHFVINILSETQSKICDNFSNNKLDHFERFKEVETTSSINNIKIISNSIAWIECKTVDFVKAGDHNIYIGEVTDGEVVSHDKPLVYQEGEIKKII